MLFAAANYRVVLYDVKAEKVDEALADIKVQLENLEHQQLLRGTLTAAQQLSLISGTNSMQDLVRGAIHIQECVFEDLELKRNVFAQLDDLLTNVTSSDPVAQRCVLSSSTSCFQPSLVFAKVVKHLPQCIVSHPVNPPYYVPLVELVPAGYTSPDVLSRTRALMEEIGQKPVVINKEPQGFVVNRIQYAILAECYRLIKDGVISVADCDRVMSCGLGPRYAFMGPWETAHLNALGGMKEYFEKYAQGIFHVASTFGPNPMMEGDVADRITRELEQMVPTQELTERRRWRDDRLTALAVLKKNMDSAEKKSK